MTKKERLQQRVTKLYLEYQDLKWLEEILHEECETDKGEKAWKKISNKLTKLGDRLQAAEFKLKYFRG